MASASHLSFVEGQFACNPNATPHTEKQPGLSKGADTSKVSRDTWNIFEMMYVDNKMNQYRNTPRGELKAVYEKSKALFSSMDTRLGPFVAHSHTRVLLHIASVFVFFIPAMVATSLIVFIVLLVVAKDLVYVNNLSSTWKGILKCCVFLIILWFMKASLQLR